MAKADLHVHSRFSSRSSEWFLQRIGTAESYTDPETIFRNARAQGMDFVTITDHDTLEGALFLKERYPEIVFTGVESTAFFPEDGSKVHILVYNLTEREFESIERLRSDVYDLRSFLRERGLPHAVTHPAYSGSQRLTAGHLEKLVLLFDHFEAINGGWTRRLNESWSSFLRNLTPDDIQRMRETHRIEPFGPEPWKKGLIGGSDDHAGLFIGMTWTSGPGAGIDEFFRGFAEKRTEAHGRHNDFKGLAFSFYKTAIDFARTRRDDYTTSFMSGVAGLLLENRKLSITQRFQLLILKSRSAARLKIMIDELIEATRSPEYNDSIDTRLSIVYDKLTLIGDEFLRELFGSIGKDLEQGNLLEIVKNVSASLPGFFVSVPIVTSFRHLFEPRTGIETLRERYGGQNPAGRKKILWFTDTFADLNGISVTLGTLAERSVERGRDIVIVTSLLPTECGNGLPNSVLNLPPVFEFPLPYYERQVLKVPSLFAAIRFVYEEDPDEIIVSTPGPIGLVGLAMAKLLNIPSIGIYHTDYRLEATYIGADEPLVETLESYVTWFYHGFDEVRVPTEEYIRILRKRGYGSSRLALFRRGVDTALFRPDRPRSPIVLEAWGKEPGFVLAFTGRVSKDKNLDFLFEVFGRLSAVRPDFRLVIAGDGPYLVELAARYGGTGTVLFTGRVANRELPPVYAAADLFVFPSTTDTFGMSVLEALSCGVPCLVSDIGGPQELVSADVTGYVLPVTDPGLWVEKILTLREMKETDSAAFGAIKTAARTKAVRDHDWSAILDELTVHRSGRAVPS